MNYEASNRTAALFLNVSIVVMEIYATMLSFRSEGATALQYYTILANLLTLVTSALFIWSAALKERALNELRSHAKPRSIAGKDSRKAVAARLDDVLEAAERRTEKIRLLRFVAVTCLALTMLIAVTVLALLFFKAGNLSGAIWDGPQKFHHLLCPILSVLSFVFLEPGPAIGRRTLLAPVALTFAYALVLLGLNVGGVLSGPYPFLQVHTQSVLTSALWFVGILAAAFGIALLLRKLNRDHAE